MNYTQGQQEAISMVETLAGLQGAKPFVGVLAGAAGTGKTTTVRAIAETLGFPMVIAPTGKAALRVYEATGVKAKTIHSWLYSPNEDENTGEVHWIPKESGKVERGETNVLVVDEASMVGPDLWADIYDMCTVLKLNILLVGDPFQLPPVQRPDAAPFSLLDPSLNFWRRVELTEIVRQALESPIIRASILVREGRAAQAIMTLPRVTPQDVVPYASHLYKTGGTTICHRNETRLRLNTWVRGALGHHPDELAPNEPLLVMQNCHQLEVFNGETLRFNSWVEAPVGVHTIKDWIRKADATSRFGLASVGESGVAILAEAGVLGKLQHIHPLPIRKQAHRIFPAKIDTGRVDFNGDPVLRYQPVLNAQLGYIITAHKSQGSEWPNVLVVVESSIRHHTEEGRRWLYTALTRAKESVAVSLGSGA